MDVGDEHFILMTADVNFVANISLVLNKNTRLGAQVRLFLGFQTSDDPWIHRPVGRPRRGQRIETLPFLGGLMKRTPRNQGRTNTPYNRLILLPRKFFHLLFLSTGQFLSLLLSINPCHKHILRLKMQHFNNCENWCSVTVLNVISCFSLDSIDLGFDLEFSVAPIQSEMGKIN